ncbi:unnamed protein product, partial [Staurois parvus]
RRRRRVRKVAWERDVQEREKLLVEVFGSWESRVIGGGGGCRRWVKEAVRTQYTIVSEEQKDI